MTKFSEEELKEARTAGRLEAERQRAAADEKRDVLIRRSFGAIAVLVVILLVWQPWNADKRAAQSVSDAYYQADSTFITCTPAQQSTSAIVECWSTYQGALNSISWPPSISNQASSVEMDAGQVISSLQSGQGYDAALTQWGTDKDALETSLNALTTSN